MFIAISKVASEDTVFLVDFSRSMYRADLLGRSRIYWALMSLKEIIEKKQKIDSNDRYSLIMYSDKNLELKDYVYNFPGVFEFIDEYAELTGKSELPLDRAVKSIINEKRKIGQKIFRIIIISDGHIHPGVSNPIKFAKLAKDLGIICDAVRFGKGRVSGNILKRIVEITGGQYFFINDEDEYLEVIERIAQKKKIKVGSILDDDEDDSLDSLSKDIASPLLKLDDITGEQKASINFEELKCAICHVEECMTCETSFYGCGRFCPNCLKPIHLHCAIKWSEQQQGTSNGNGDSKILRCPFCYYLLKIPITIQKEIIVNSDEQNIIKRIRFADDASELMTSLCGHPECGIMFDDTIDNYVYKCQACGEYFHEDCLLKDYSRNHKCPNCKSNSILN